MTASTKDCTVARSSAPPSTARSAGTDDAGANSACALAAAVDSALEGRKAAESFS